MNTKRALIFLLAAVALAAGILLIESPDRPRVDDAEGRMFVPGFDSDDVASIEVSQLLDGATLKREGDGWVVTEKVAPLRQQLLEKEGREMPDAEWKAADPSRVSLALGSFGGLGEGVVVSRNPDKRALYRVDATGLHVRLIGEDGRIIADVVIGKNGPDYASTYVRRANEDEVHLVDRPLLGPFSPVANDWLARETKKDPAGEAPPRDPSS